MRYLITPLLLVVATTVSAQTKVYVSGSGNDSIGNRLVYSVKEAIRRSAGMRLADTEQDSFIRVGIVTLDPDENVNVANTRTIYSAVWTAQTFHETPVTMFLTSSVGVCGANRINACAENIAADTDVQASEMRGVVKKAFKIRD